MRFSPDDLKTMAINEFGLKKFIKKLNTKKEIQNKAQKDTLFGAGLIIEFLLHPILIRGDITIIYGGKGLGKTALALFLSYLIAFGRTFGVLKSVMANIVLYIDAEIGEAGLKSRIISNRRLFGLSPLNNANMWFQSKKYNLYTAEGRQVLAEEIDRIDPDVLLLDNLTSMNGGRDYPTGWDDFFAWLQTYQKQGMSIIILYHANNDNEIRGSKSKIINADNPIFLERIEEPNDSEDLDVQAVEGMEKNNTQKKTKLEKLPQDRTKIKVQMIFENLRNNPFPEAYTPIQLEYSIKENTWSMINYEEYMKEVLASLSEYCTDEEMSKFFGESPRQIKALRSKYQVNKYNI
jgi:AAA domain-containing protein